MFDYESLKLMAKTMGRPVAELLALAPHNDPFYAGIDGRTREAEWFADIWAQYGAGVFHLRRLHYKTSSSGTARLLNGQPYENTLNCWKTLIRASLSARYLDLLPEDALIDQRNDKPMILAPAIGVRGGVFCNVYEREVYVDLPEMPDLPGAYIEGLSDTDAIQNFICEVWIEKSGENDWLIPLCQRRGVNLVVGIGEQSEIRSRELALRAAESGAPVRVIYLSDFDPAGRSMPKAVARKVEFTIQKHGLDVDLQLIPLALTPEQCQRYELPRVPIKEGERRKDKFERIFGVGATELDAMEALHPGVLGRLLEVEIDRFLDGTLLGRVQRAYWDVRLPLKKIEEQVRAKHEQKIGELKARFDEICEELRDWEIEASDLWEDMASEIEEQLPDLSDIEVPQPEIAGQTDRFILFDSTRDYFTQMDAYNAWRDGSADDGEAT